MSRTKILALLAGLGVAGLVAASAAQLNVSADDLGAGVTVVASCDTDGVDVSFTQIEYNQEIAPIGGAQVTEVSVGGIAAGCVGQDLSLTLTKTVVVEVEEDVFEDQQEEIVTVSEVVTSPITTVDVTGPPIVNAAEVTGVAVVITG